MHKPKFTIRPIPAPGESLSSLWSRICMSNHNEVLDLIKLFGWNNKLSSSRIHLIDRLPSTVANIRLMSQWLSISEDSINNMSFYPVVRKFYSDDEINNFKSASCAILKNCIITDRRRFCSKCLVEGRKYQNIWQVAEINICNVHYTKLSHECQSCNSTYANQGFKILKKENYYHCDYNGHNLKFQKQEEIKEKNEIQDQLRKYKDWSFLLKPKKQLIPYIQGLNQDQSLAIALLYLTLTDKSCVNKRNSNLSSFYFSNFKHVIAQTKETILKIEIMRLLSILRENGIQLEDIMNTHIPNDFIRSIKDSKQSTICLSPWCVSYRSDEKIKKVRHHARVSFNRNIYNGRSVCTKCWMQYGYEKNSKVWKAIDNDMITMIEQTPELLSMNLSINKVCKRLQTSKTTLNKIIGYLCQHNGLPQKLLQRYTPTKKVEDIVGKFKQLVKKEDGKGLYIAAKSLFGWNLIEYYYHWSNPKVQCYLIFSAYSDRLRYKAIASKRQKYDGVVMREEVENTTKEFLSTDITITVSVVANKLGVSAGTLRLYGLNQLITDQIKKQRLLRKNNKEMRLWHIADVYLTAKEMADEVVTVHEVMLHLGFKSSTITYPELSKKVSSRVEALKNVVKEKKIKIMKEKASQLLFSAPEATNNEIAMFIGEKYKNLFATYPEVVLHIQQFRLENQNRTRVTSMI